MKPWSAPTAAPRPMPSARAMTQRNGKSAPMPEDRGQPVGHQQRVGHRDEPDERPDRQVDVARHDDQDHAGRDDRDAGGLDGQRDHVRRLDELAAAQDVEREQDHDERDEHAEQAEVDLRLGEQAADRRSGREAGPDRIPVSRRPRSSRRPSWSWLKSDLRPRGTRGRRSIASSSGRMTVTCRRPAPVAASTPLQSLVLGDLPGVDRRLQVVRGERRRLEDERLDGVAARGREVCGGEAGGRSDRRVDQAVRERQAGQSRCPRRARARPRRRPCPARWRSSRRRRTACPARRCSGWRGRRPGR